MAARTYNEPVAETLESEQHDVVRLHRPRGYETTDRGRLPERQRQLWRWVGPAESSEQPQAPT